MLNTRKDQPTAVDPLYLNSKDTRRVLGNAGETTLWDWVNRGFLHPRYSGRKVLFDYPEVTELGRLIKDGKLAPARSAFSDHAAAIKNSIESRRRKAQVRANTSPAEHRIAPAGANPPPEGPGRRP
jgi:hypothetical protein